MIRRAPGRVAAATLGCWLLAAVVGPVAVPSLGASAAAAIPDLTVVSNARYDVQPTHQRVHVTVNLSATNHHADTVIRSYFFDHVVLGFLPDATGFTVAAPTGSTARPTVHVTSRDAARVLVSVAFGSKLRSGRTLALKLTFDLVDKGGALDRPVRVGSAIATFPVWAVGTPDTPGSRVSVTAPADFRVEVLGGPLAGPSKGPGGTNAYTSASLSTTAGFGAYVLADRPGAYRETPVEVKVGGTPYAVVVRSWQDDSAFGSRVASLLRRALPALGTLVGARPVARGADGAPLAVEEAVTRSAGGYAALFDGGSARIQVAYDATPAVILHEAAHAWFNGNLVADRWMAEGFASYYAARAADPLKIEVTPLPLTKTLLARRFPLNAWGADASADPVLDAYGMAASLQLANLIAERIGPDGLTTVWKAIEAGEMADQPPSGAGGSTAAEAETDGAAAPDWRALLDLIETRTGKDLTDLWRTWVVQPDQGALLDRRTEVRAAWAGLVAEADGWALPKAIRIALDRWQFDQAADLITRTKAILAARPGLASAAEAVDVRLPTTLRTAFESAAGPTAAATELAAERAAIDRLATDIATKPVDPTPVEQIGLLGTDPESDITAARASFAAGDLKGAVAAADRAALTWVGALDVGRGRLAVAAGILAIFAALVLLVTATRDRRSRARWSYRAGQVIRSMGPGSGPRSRPGAMPLRDVGPRSVAAAPTSGVQVTNRHASHVSPAVVPMAHRLDVAPGTSATAGATAWPRYGAAPPTVPQPRDVAAPPTQPQPRNVAAPPTLPQPRDVAAPPTQPQPRNVAAPRDGYGTLAAGPSAERSQATLSDHRATGRRPDAGPRPGDVPPDPAPGDE